MSAQSPAMDLPGIDGLDVRGRRVLVRVDFNVPQDESGGITDDTRIRAALPTIERLFERGARVVVLMSHLGRPKDGPDERFRLAPVGRRLGELLGRAVVTLRETVGEAAERAVGDAPEGAVVLLENVRFERGETKGDGDLAARMARLGDVFVNDAFGSSHRDHSSVSGVARLLPSAAGLLLEKEIQAFQRVLSNPERPLVAILGGAKVSDKLKVIDNLLDRVDRLLVGGGMAYTFLAAKGIGVGASLVQADQVDSVRAAMEKAERRGVALHLPVDHVIAQRFAADAPPREVEGDIPEGWMALDIGPRTRADYAAALADARTVVWNGPMGVFEWKPFAAGTETVGRAVAACSGYTVVGGGDSVAAAEAFGLTSSLSHVSTGGGASLELLEGLDLPGIAALRR